MSKWSTRFIELADHIAGWSKDPSTQVGAVIVTPSNRIVSVGYNGYPHGVDDEIASREQKLARTIHAEMNAIHFAMRDISGFHLYCTHAPCSQCMAHAIQRGISKVFYRAPTAEFRERWADSMKESAQMAKEASVEVFVFR